MCFDGLVDGEVDVVFNDEENVVFDDEINSVVNVIVDGVSFGVFRLVNVDSFTAFSSCGAIGPFFYIDVLYAFNIFNILSAFNRLLISSDFPPSSLSWNDNT